MIFLTPRYDFVVVVASMAIAFLASYVALDLADRIHSKSRSSARVWWAGGSIAMGTGIWSMHFVGMLAFELPIELGYTGGLTLVSWLAAVAVSGIALGIAAGTSTTLLRIAGGALVMGAGICAMHYTGMAALEMMPGIVWNPWLIAASAAIAVVASAAALQIFFWLRGSDRRGNLGRRLGAAIVMGLAISDMHYTGMSAAGFVTGSWCRSVDQLGGAQLGTLVMLASGALLLLTLFTSTLDARMQDKNARLAASLQSANSQLRSANDELKKRAFLDPLTGLPNRLLFEDRLEHALSRFDRSGSRTHLRLAVLFIDLDGFKPINDSLGHAAGDKVLVDVATRLSEAARESDTVARIGGDEFVMLMEDIVDATDCAALAQRAVDALSRPFMFEGRSLQISASVGIAIHPDHGDGRQLMSHADAAMYAAKRAGGKTYALYEAHMKQGVAEQLTLQTDLRRAVANGELSLHYQPKFDGRRAQIRGVEALMRWTHPEHGNVPPMVFIPIAERYGMIRDLGNWAIDEACRQMHEWDEEGMRMRVAVNLSVHQLRQDDLVERVQVALDTHLIEADRLLCEITESTAMEDIEATQKAFEGLSRIGVFLSIDDFGTGYSSLSYLRTLPAKQLKIDRSFISDLEISKDARAVVDAVIKLAHALDLNVVAEGVETEGQRDILLELGCDELQGYLFARPMPAAQLLEWAGGMRPEGSTPFSPSVFADTETMASLER